MCVGTCLHMSLSFVPIGVGRVIGYDYDKYGPQTQGTSMANVRMPRSQLTFSQQGQVRANLMKSAAAIAGQLNEYINDGFITVAGKEITMTTERIQAYRLVLSKTVPDLSATEITHKSGLEAMDTGQLVARLAQLAQARPELRKQLHEVLGGKLIEGQAQPADFTHHTTPESHSAQPEAAETAACEVEHSPTPSA